MKWDDLLPQWPLFIEQAAVILERPLFQTEIDRYQQFFSSLLQWNQIHNLIGPAAERELLIRHGLDSLSFYPYLVSGRPMADLGSGAGFPGLILGMIEQPAFQIDLLERIGKKRDFLAYQIDQLQLTARLRSLAAGDSQEGYAVVCSRAVGDLAHVARQAWPLLQPGGVYLALKGARHQQELQQWQRLKQIRDRFEAPQPLAGVGESIVIRLRRRTPHPPAPSPTGGEGEA
ncbi:MAG: 16S rRNA (guanine(527)-N(7))-methyltransferase RsmG [Magnetococcales bacterium]|nr:16S rRNA (guanine(527)-N(7))-methyltransferase RsmG [Magnetococcales bacterium]